jgi:hypothetical protein
MSGKLIEQQETAQGAILARLPQPTFTQNFLGGYPE